MELAIIVRPSENNFESEDPLLENERKKIKTCLKLHKGCKITITIIIIFFLMAFSIIFIDFPLVFMHSLKLQQKILFMPSEDFPEKFINIKKYVNGARNFYVTVNKTTNITLGVWHLLPEELLVNISSSIKDENFNYNKYLAQSNYPVLLHFHGNSGNRIYNKDIYVKLRKYFHVIGFDYRNYGDSSKGALKEEEMVQDSVEFYKWLLSNTAPDNIYLWGHSLGAALATSTIAKLSENNIITPMGLILEAPFTTLREEIQNSNFATVFSWLPWFDLTILNGFERHGFYFKTSENILKVDCPILILHAENDNLVPYTLAKKLYEIAQKKRNPITQGNATFHLFAAKYNNNYDHWGITDAPELGHYIKNHFSNCWDYNNKKKNKC